mgnify:CR=1 FL=1
MRRRITASTLALVVAVSAGAASGATRQEAARDGVRYLISRQHANGSFPGFSPIGSTADAALAMAMAVMVMVSSFEREVRTWLETALVAGAGH